MLGYASAAGVGWSLLTNGDNYRLYNANAPVPAEEKLFRNVRLSQADQTDRCLEMFSLLAKAQMSKPDLDALWQSQFVDRRVGATLTALFATDDAALADLVCKRSPELAVSEVRESLQRAQVQVRFPEVAQVASAAPASPVQPPKAPSGKAIQLADLIAAGLIKPPLVLQKTYKGVSLEATVEADGRVHFAGESHESLSIAGGTARKSVSGAPADEPAPATNGWTFWQYRDSQTGALRPIADLRQQHLRDDA